MLKYDIKMNFFEFGSGKEKKCLILIHGWGVNSRSFFPIVPFLHKDFKIYLIDLPGFGKTKFDPKLKSSFDYAQEVLKWIKSKKLKNVNLLGHSFGGRVTSILAQENPNLINKLILISPSGLPNKKLKFIYKIKDILPPKIVKKISPIARRIFSSRDYKNSGGKIKLFKKIVKEDLTQIFKRIKTPTLIIWGKNDKELNWKLGEKLNKLIKRSQLVIVPGDHFPFIEKPEETANLIKDFIKGK